MPRRKRSVTPPVPAKESQATSAVVTDIDFIPAILADRERAASARESFVEYYKFVGRNEGGDKLRLNHELLRSAEAFEKAYRAGKDFDAEQKRGSLKSTQAVCGHTWMLGREPRLTIGHFSCRDDEAERRNEWLQAVLRQKEHRAVFGDAATPVDSLCNKSETSIRGNPRPKSNPNVVARGIESARAGPHFHRLWGDDLVDEKTSLTEPARLIIVKDRWHRTVRPMLMSRALCRDLGIEGGGCTYYDGTPYAENDLHDDQVKAALKGAEAIYSDAPFSWVYESERAVFRRLACGGPDEGFFSPCPELISPAELAEIYERNPRAYDMAYRLIAVGAGERPFTKLHFWLHENWKIRPELVEAAGYAVPQLPNSEWATDDPNRHWPRVLVVDPGFTEGRDASDTGYVVGTLAPDNRIYLLHATHFRVRWDQGLDRLIEAARRWKVDLVIIEEAAQQVALQRYFREKGLLCEGIPHRSKSKEIRAWDVSAEVNSGRVLLPGQVLFAGKTQKLGPSRDRRFGHAERLAEQLLAFPGCANRDLVDAFVYLVQALRERATPLAASPAQPRQTLLAAHIARQLGIGIDENESGAARHEWNMFAGGGTWN